MRIETVADRVLSAAKSGEQAPHLHIAACWCARAVTRARESRGLVGRTAAANAGAPEGFRRHAVRTTEISRAFRGCAPRFAQAAWLRPPRSGAERSEEHTSELQPRFGNSEAAFCLKKKMKYMYE